MSRINFHYLVNITDVLKWLRVFGAANDIFQFYMMWKQNGEKQFYSTLVSLNSHQFTTKFIFRCSETFLVIFYSKCFLETCLEKKSFAIDKLSNCSEMWCIDKISKLVTTGTSFHWFFEHLLGFIWSIIFTFHRFLIPKIPTYFTYFHIFWQQHLMFTYF